MEEVLDIFRNDAFSTATLERVVSNIDFVPQALGELGVFSGDNVKPIDTEFVILYEEDGTFHIIPTTERGSPDVMQTRDQGRFRALKCPRISKKDTVRASELLGVANQALPSTIRLRNAVELVNERLGKLRSDRELTFEYHRLGSMQGKLLDADGTTVIYDYYAEMGVTQAPIIDVDFANITEADFMMFFQDNFYRPTLRALKNRKTPTTQLAALVGDGFWSRLQRHPGFREIYKLEMQARAIARATNPLVQPNAWMSVDFGGVLWINYMGTDDGTTVAVASDMAYFFPLNAKDVFRLYLAPGETFSQVGPGIKGKLEYPIIRPDPRADPEFIDILLRSYALHACIYPKALSRARIKP